MYDEYTDEFYNLVDQYVASGRYGGRPEAADAVRRARPDLCPTARSKDTMMTISSIASGSAEAQLNAMAKRIAAERRVTFAQAYVEALNGDPHLYLAYLPGARRG